MAEPTLQEIFGTNSTQDASSIIIDKADLSTVGLTPGAANTAESLLAAIVVFAQQTLTTTRQDANPEQSITIDDSLESLTTRNDNTYRQLTKTINFEKLDAQATFDPDDY